MGKRMHPPDPNGLKDLKGQYLVWWWCIPVPDVDEGGRPGSDYSKSLQTLFLCGPLG